MGLSLAFESVPDGGDAHKIVEVSLQCRLDITNFCAQSSDKLSGREHFEEKSRNQSNQWRRLEAQRLHRPARETRHRKIPPAEKSVRRPSACTVGSAVASSHPRSACTLKTWGAHEWAERVGF